MRSAELIAHIPSLRRYARVLTGDSWSADDLVQDTLERACSKWHLWVVGTNLRAWLFTIMHNLRISDVRHELSRHNAGGAVDIADVVNELVAPSAAIDVSLDLQRCLLQLPEEQRTVLLLVTLEDISYADVARITKSPIGTVMSRLSRARGRLQILLNAPANTPPVTATDGAVITLRRLK